ncbi:peptidase S8/S53 domain-containing protein [Paraphysoderma sedebokerense]|nr:peptidase S8/S53 domain-containing protein [Paraphysoderma sedebokerense]
MTKWRSVSAVILLLAYNALVVNAVIPKIYRRQDISLVPRNVNTEIFNKVLSSIYSSSGASSRDSSQRLRSLSTGSGGSLISSVVAATDDQVPINQTIPTEFPTYPLTYYNAPSNSIIPDKYIITFSEKCPHKAALDRMDVLLTSLGGDILHTYDAVMHGYRITFPPKPKPSSTQSNNTDTWMNMLKKVPCIDSISEEQLFTTTQIQEKPSWGLDRLDQRSAQLDNLYKFDVTGRGVEIWVLDSGIQTNHPEFTGRAELAYIVNSVRQLRGTGTRSRTGIQSDCTGHGTHVAGIAAGLNVGIAKQSLIKSVRVLECSDSSNADVIEALDFVARTATAPAVINLSLGPHPNPNLTYSRVPVMDEAIKRILDRGISVVVAAGNDGLDACSGSPAGVDGVLTVGATALDGNTDIRASFSNVGACVNVWAPGFDILSSFPSTSDSQNYAALRGTSQAAPFVTGVVAQILQLNPRASPREVANILTQNAVRGAIRDIRNSPNVLLQAINNGTADQRTIIVPLTGINSGDTILGIPSTIFVASVTSGVVVLFLAVLLLLRCRRRRAAKGRVDSAKDVENGPDDKESGLSSDNNMSKPFFTNLDSMISNTNSQPVAARSYQSDNKQARKAKDPSPPRLMDGRNVAAAQGIPATTSKLAHPYQRQQSPPRLAPPTGYQRPASISVSRKINMNSRNNDDKKLRPNSVASGSITRGLTAGDVSWTHNPLYGANVPLSPTQVEQPNFFTPPSSPLPPPPTVNDFGLNTSKPPMPKLSPVKTLPEVPVLPPLSFNQPNNGNKQQTSSKKVSNNKVGPTTQNSTIPQSLMDPQTEIKLPNVLQNKPPRVSSKRPKLPKGANTLQRKSKANTAVPRVRRGSAVSFGTGSRRVSAVARSRRPSKTGKNVIVKVKARTVKRKKGKGTGTE